jgi:hypothetical protein
MTLNLGIIRVGLIGQDHIRRITTVLSGTRVAVVTDVGLHRAHAVAGQLRDARVHETGEDLIAQQRINSVSNGSSTGPSAWDGYAATVICDAGIDAVHSGERVEIALRDQPDVYKAGAGSASGRPGG